MNESAIIENTPKYQQVCDLLHERICSGEYPPGSMLPSCRTLSRDLGISYLTVTDALRRLVNRGIVRSQPGKGFFVCDNQAATLSRENAWTSQAGFIIPTSGDVFHNYFTPIMRELGEAGIAAIPVTNVFLLDEMEPEQRREQILNIAGRNLDALVVHGDRGFPFRFLKEIEQQLRQLIIVFMDDSNGDFSQATRILVDFQHLGQLAAEHFFAQGVERLAFLTYEEMPEVKHRLNGISRHCHGELVFDGIEKATKAAGRDFFADCAFIRDEINGEANEEGLADFLRSSAGRPCGVVIHGDFRAKLLYKVAAQLGLEIGKDVLAVGIYNTVWTEMLHPALSSFCVNEERIAMLTAQAIKEKWSGRTVMVEPELVIRESSLIKSES